MTELSDYYLERLGTHNPAVGSIPLRVGANTIGRLPTNNIVLSSKYVSRRHCTIYVTDTDQITAKNDAVTNGVFINGMQRTDQDNDICLKLNDLVGIGCDTSKDEICDTECFVFMIKRKNVEIKPDEIVLLDDSDEEECKILEEYSQMNLSEMKQEYMECEDFLEVMNSSKNENADVKPVAVEYQVSQDYKRIDADEVFDEIIASSSKSYAEKTAMVKNVVPDVSSFLMKDCAVEERGESSASAILTNGCNQLPSNLSKRTKEEAKESKPRVKKESSKRRHERKSRSRDRKAVIEKCDDTKEHIKEAKKIEKSPPLQINELNVTIPLTRVDFKSSDKRRRRSSSAREKGSKDRSNKSNTTELHRRNSSTRSPYEKAHTSRYRTRNSSSSSTPPLTETSRKESAKQTSSAREKVSKDSSINKSNTANHATGLHRRNSSITSPDQKVHTSRSRSRNSSITSPDQEAHTSRSRSRNSPGSSTSPLAETSQKESVKSKETSSSRIMHRRYTHVPSSTSAVPKTCKTDAAQKECQNDSTKPPEATSSRILQRRESFVPSSTLSSGSTKRQLEIIAAPHMMKRRKSMSAMAEINIAPSKVQNTDAKWLSKIVQPVNKRRSLEEKNEIKSKLAALVPKDKVPETKTVRTHTKIPVKNTHRTRNDFLTDTIVKTVTVSRKHKLNGTTVPNEISKVPRIAEDEVIVEKQTSFEERRPSVGQREVGKFMELRRRSTGVRLRSTEEGHRSAEIKPKTTEVKSNNEQRNTHLSSDLNEAGSSTDAATVTAKSPVVKSILKKSNSIQKRRATVTFAEESRVKTFSTVAPAVPAIRSEEDNVDDVIHNIMALGMSALKQSSSALINGKNFSYKAVAHEYDSIGHLQNVFVPLMKAELWKEIEDGYAHSKNTAAVNVQMNYCSRDENHPNRYKCHCESQSLGLIQNGALVLILSVHSGKEFLGYITNRQLTNNVCYFQFVTACSVESNGSTPTPLKLKPIMYVRPNLKVFEALFKLKNSPLLHHILHPIQNYTKPQKQPFQYTGYNSLNQDQMMTLSAVYRKCIGGHPFISLIEGPPGTGKSRLVTNLVVQLLYGKEITQPLKILVCAPSNAAVDLLTKNLMEARKNYVIKEGQKKMKLVRFGVLEKMDMSVRNVSIQCLTNHNEKTKLIEQSRLAECKKKKEAELAAHSAKHARDKIMAVRKEISAIEAKIKNVTYDEKCLLEGANVICTTLNSCCALSSKISTIDICIIDEATQCNEPTSLIPLQFGVRSLVLVGDTKQLPSTVLSEIAKQYNYDQSLFQRLQKSFESENKFESPILQLTTQYRMHPDILHWPNQYFYKNQLTSADETSKFALKLKPYTVFNLNYVQSQHNGHQKHISNVDEAKFVRNLLDFLLTQANPKNFTYGIISAYSQQKNDLAKELSETHPYVTVNTIDSCQGQERDIVIISIARTRGIGFLAIRQRLNVALTRAKKMLILCGNFNSLQSHPMWTNLLDDARKRKLFINFPPTIEDNSLSSYFQDTLTT